MFQRITVYSFLCLSLVLLLWTVLFVRVRPQDMEACLRLQTEDKTVSSQALLSAIYQERKDVKKEIYLTQEDNSRLHYRIHSQFSLLTAQPQGKKVELNEKLEKIKCWMQDKLYFASPKATPMQQVRFLEAEEGLYCYATQKFLAQSVTLSLFRLPGHSVPMTLDVAPFLKGVAADVSFSVSGKAPQFKAQHFKAELNHNTEESL